MTEEFKSSPKDVRVAEGKQARLQCDPPKASPTPSVTWFHNDRPVDLIAAGNNAPGGRMSSNGEDESSSEGMTGSAEKPAGRRVRIAHDSFDLIIEQVKKDDEGMYVCQAENAAATRRSAPARLTVLGEVNFTFLKYSILNENRPKNANLWKKKNVEIIYLAEMTRI
jgi:hypothetical protein